MIQSSVSRSMECISSTLEQAIPASGRFSARCGASLQSKRKTDAVAKSPEETGHDERLGSAYSERLGRWMKFRWHSTGNLARREKNVIVTS